MRKGFVIGGIVSKAVFAIVAVILLLLFDIMLDSEKSYGCGKTQIPGNHKHITKEREELS